MLARTELFLVSGKMRLQNKESIKFSGVLADILYAMREGILKHLSYDIACDYILMDGLIYSYGLGKQIYVKG